MNLYPDNITPAEVAAMKKSIADGIEVSELVKRFISTLEETWAKNDALKQEMVDDYVLFKDHESACHYASSSAVFGEREAVFEILDGMIIDAADNNRPEASAALSAVRERIKHRQRHG